MVIALTGLWDDIRGLNSTSKLIGQALAAALLIIGGCRIETLYGPFGGSLALGMFGIPFTFLWIILIINAINLMDGLDGLAAGVGFLISLGFVSMGILTDNVSNLIIALGLAAGLLGFLRYNYHPASIFMGDVGSLQLGYILAFLSIESLKIAGSHHVYFLSALVLLAVPLGDTMISFFRRLGQGKNPFLADKQHVHHRLLNLGLTHLQTVWLLYIFTFLFVLLGVLMSYFQDLVSFVLFLIALFSEVFWIWRLGYVETRFSHQNIIPTYSPSTGVWSRPPLFLSHIWHIILLLASDIIALNLALVATYWVKFQSGLFTSPTYRSISDYFSTQVFLLITLGWLALFFVNNLYRMRWDVARFDKAWQIIKVISFGILVFGIITLDAESMFSRSQVLSLSIYWFFLVLFVIVGRLLIIEVEKRFQILEYSPKKTLIIGCNEIGKNVLQDIANNPHFIYDVVGFISKNFNREEFENLPVLGSYEDLPAIIHHHKIEEIIIALEESATDDFIQILSLCDQQQVIIKTPPGTHEIFTTQQVSLVSHAYLRIFPENMVLWQWILKRIFDILLALISIIILSPLIITIAIYSRIKFGKSPFVGVPIIGKFGVPFQMWVFRMTYADYHYEKNPVYLGMGMVPEQLNPVSKFLFRYRLYKIPQIFNVLLGDMSFVGPRPEYQEWYEFYKDKIRFIYRRLLVRPGLTGLAQVKYHYELSQKVIQERVKFDIFYTENMSLRLDLRILLRTLLMVFRKPGELPLEPIPTEKKQEAPLYSDKPS
ncbi:MAG: hypothetical protein Kow0042_08140 [Calditrichia bacterium]